MTGGRAGRWKEQLAGIAIHGHVLCWGNLRKGRCGRQLGLKGTIAVFFGVTDDIL